MPLSVSSLFVVQLPQNLAWWYYGTNFAFLTHFMKKCYQKEENNVWHWIDKYADLSYEAYRFIDFFQ